MRDEDAVLSNVELEAITIKPKASPKKKAPTKKNYINASNIAVRIPGTRSLWMPRSILQFYEKDVKDLLDAGRIKEV